MDNGGVISAVTTEKLPEKVLLGVIWFLLGVITAV
jgi:hypothetical protein